MLSQAGESTSSASVSATIPRFHVKFGAKQFIEPGTNKRRAKRLRRKETRIKKQIIRDVNTLKQHEVKNVPLKVDPVLGDPNCGFVERIMKKVENQELTLAYGIDRVEFENFYMQLRSCHLKMLPRTKLYENPLFKQKKTKEKPL